MVIHAERVALPDLQARAAHGAALRIEHAAAQMQDGAGGALRATGDLDQIVVRIERQLEGIERAGGLSRRRRQARRAGRQSVQPGDRGRGQDHTPPRQAGMQGSPWCRLRACHPKIWQRVGGEATHQLVRATSSRAESDAPALPDGWPGRGAMAKRVQEARFDLVILAPRAIGAMGELDQHRLEVRHIVATEDDRTCSGLDRISFQPQRQGRPMLYTSVRWRTARTSVQRTRYCRTGG